MFEMYAEMERETLKIVNYTKVLRATVELDDIDIRDIRSCLKDRSEYMHSLINAHDEISLDRKKILREELTNINKMIEMLRDLATS